MLIDNEAVHKSKKINDIISETESNFFVGRQKELAIFQAFIEEKNSVEKILYIQGNGGIGKSYLLSEFSRIASKQNILFVQLDSQDFIHTPFRFVEYLVSLIEAQLHLANTSKHLVQDYLKHLAQITSTKQLIIAIDTYEKMDDLDRWFRQVFLRQIGSNILFVLAGRCELKGEWTESPAWRKVTRSIRLEEFNLSQTRTYLSHYGIRNQEMLESIWSFSNGHPLTLSLATLTTNPIAFEQNNPTDSLSNILLQLTKRWLQEVEDKEMHHLIEAAAILNSFDQQLLASIINQEVSLKNFQQLTSLSFIKPSRNGWAMHELIRDVVNLELRYRYSAQHKLLNERCVAYFYQRIIKKRSNYDISQFFYHLGDEFIQSVLFQTPIDHTMYMEQVSTHNLHELVAFLEHRKAHLSKSDVQFYHRKSNQYFRFQASKAYNQKEVELFTADYFDKVGHDVASLIKNEAGETLGLSVVVPINEQTVPILASEPVSRTFFSTLTEAEFKEYKAPAGSNAGWFIRLLEYADTTDIAARSFSMYSLFPLLLSGGKIIASTPLVFFQDLLKNFGFSEVPHATHYDYGEEFPATTYLLDLSGPKFAMYLSQLANGGDKRSQFDSIADTFSLTKREKEIVLRILDDESNQEIAKSLFLAEITVKKQITKIFQKVAVKNRRQLIKKIMEHIKTIF